MQSERPCSPSKSQLRPRILIRCPDKSSSHRTSLPRSYILAVLLQFNLLHHFFLVAFFLITSINLSRILFTSELGVNDRQRMSSPNRKVMSVTFSCAVMLYQILPSLSLYVSSVVRFHRDWMNICCSSVSLSSGSIPCWKPPSMTSSLLFTMPT